MTARLRINVVPRAQQQIRAAVNWWAQRRPAAPHAVTEELRRAFQLLRVQPHLGTTGRHPDLEGVRRLRLSRVRYYLYYRVDDQAGLIHVLAFWHVSRGATPYP